jgi:hypothetical protein
MLLYLEVRVAVHCPLCGARALSKQEVQVIALSLELCSFMYKYSCLTVTEIAI